ncbi:MAG TPA: AsmA family protein [Nevskiaceae bacterium]|nr:AsmA family protein [Nevskiaceae bacterium]
MAKPLKILLIIVGVIVALFAALAVALPLFFNPNDHRDDIARAVKEATGREFSAGAIQLHVFPWLAVELHDITLGNAAGFGSEPFAKLADARAGVRLLPLLFGGRIAVSTVTVHGLALNLQKDRSGKNNWSDLSQNKEEKKEPQPAKVEAKGNLEIKEFAVGGVDIEDGAVAYSDAQAGKNYRIEHVNLKTGALELGEPVDFKLGLTAVSSAPALTAQITLAAKLAADTKAQQYKLDDLSFTVDASGAGVPGGKQQVTLSGNASYDGKADELKIPGAKLGAAGISIQADISGKGLTGDSPKLSGPIRVAEFSPREVLGKLGQKIETTDANALKSMSLSANYSGTFKSALLDAVALKLDQTTASGSIDVRDFATADIRFALKVDQFDADRYSSPRGKAQAQAEKKPVDSKTLNETELPLDAIADLNAQGTLDVGQLKVSGLTLTGASVKLDGARGQVKNLDVGAKLYSGSITMHTKVTPGAKPQLATATKLAGLQTGPFLHDFMGKDILSGVGNFDLDVSGSGKTVGDLRKSLDGNVALKLDNAVVKGFNMAAILRKGQALLAGNSNYQESAPEETDFSAISATGKIANGVLTSNDLAGASPAFRLAGAGKVDLANETIDYLVKPTIVETSTGQNGKSLDQLRGVTIPIQVSGTFSAPSYKLDVASALQQKALSKVNEKIDANKAKLQDKVNNALGKLFGNRQQQPAAAPAATPSSSQH